MDILNANNSSTVAVVGHTDTSGVERFNKKLSKQRAQSVFDYLVSNGIDASRLTAVGQGESSPIASNKTQEGMALNRRVEFVVN